MQPHPIRAMLCGRSRFRPTLEQLEDRAVPATITVTSAADTIAVDGKVTLREAITSINNGANVNSDVVAVGAYGTNDTIVFNIPGSGVQTINVTGSPLPSITRPVVIDGTTQTTNNGDTNPGIFGTGGTVGVGPDGVAGSGDELALPTVNRPEVEIHGTNAIGSGLTISANNVVIRGFAIFGFGTANIDIAQNSNNTLIEQNVLGTTATSFTDPGPGVRSGGANIRVASGGTNNGIIRNNLIGFASGRGIDLRGGAATYQITGNEIRDNGLSDPTAAGIDLSGQNTVNTTVRGNLIADNRGFGIDLLVSNGNSTVDQNTITGNGVGGIQTAGVGIGGSNNKISNNLISANYGAGVLVGANGQGNSITKNSIFANGTIPSASGAPATNEIGIDLLSASDNQNTGTSPFVTLNDPGDSDLGGNGLLNFPVLTTATVNGGVLELSGFARPGSVIELFIADPDPSGFGQGKTYLVTLTEGSAADLDRTTGSYGPSSVNSLNQGSDITNRFRFDIPLASLPGVAIGTLLTATATSANSTSEFSGNVAVSQVEADLKVVKTVDTPTPNVGDVIDFTVTLTNQGTDDATGVTVNDLLPAGLSFVSATPSQGTYDSSTGVWNVGALTNGGSVTLQLQARVLSPDAQTNTASVSHSDQFDPNLANNTATASINPQQADLQVSKTVSDPTPNVGDTVTYTITVTNNGPDTASNVTVQDLLPAGLSFVSATPSQGTYDSSTGVWNVGTVTTTAAQTLTIQATVDSPSPLTNTAMIGHHDQYDPDPGNNQASATETPQQADLQVQKSVSNPHPNVDDVIVYTVTLTNAGPDAATNVVVTDLLPAGLSFVGATPSQGTYDGTTGLWNVGALASSTLATLQIQARVNSPSAQFNTAAISHSDQFDPVSGNNSASATETPQQADLQVSKTVDNPTPNVGDTVTYTITVTNNGPDTATNVTVQDILPPEVILSSSRGAGSYDPVTGIWTVGTVAVGTPQTLVLTSQVISPNPRANTATITHADQFDPNTANNSDTASINPLQADLAVGKTVSDPTPNVGDTIKFTVTLTNTGLANATNVRVTDLLPVGLALLSSNPSQGSYDPSTGLWTVGSLANGAQATLNLRARVVGHTARTNTATISHSDQFDPDPGNNSASATETPQQADLQIAKTVSDPTPNVGDVVTFTVTLADLGQDAATGVTVQDLLPAGLTLLSFNPSRGTYTPASGVWDVGAIDPSAAQTLTLTARVGSSDPQTNTATISASDQFDPDLSNNSASATETPQQADLQVTKTVSDPTPNVGDVVTFTVIVTNNGSDPATGVKLQDLLPAGLALVSATESQGVYNSTTGLWTVGQVDTTAPATLTIQAQVANSTAQTNTATISQSDQFDPDTINNTASVTVTPQPDVADLAVKKVANTPQVILGQLVTFTITVRNLGPDSATNVIVTDQLPAGLVFVSAQSSRGTYNPETGRWHIPALSANGIATLRITAEVTAVGTIRNTARVAFPGDDPDLSNNAARDAIIGIAPAGGISKRMLLGSTFF